MKKLTYLFLFLSLVFASCENQDWEYPDFNYQTVYFAHQFPVRTIVLGEDIFPNTLDNERKFRILATTGGVYENPGDITIDYTIDNSLVEEFEFEGGGNEILAMPASYYNVVEERMVIPKGELVGGITLQLTDAFFADPMAVNRNYVIPVRMNNVQNADSVLSGVAASDSPRRGVAGDWAIAPKDFVFYAVKYINPYHGFYLRRGEDVIVGKNGNTEYDTTIVRKEEFVEKDEVVELLTNSLNEVRFPLSFNDKDGNDIEVVLMLQVDEEGNISVEGPESATYTASGSGKFVKDGEKKSWGGQDRDAIYFAYEIELPEFSVSSTDTLVIRNRGVGMELFNPLLEDL